MNPNCVLAVEQAALQLGRKITAVELRDMEQRVRDNLKQLAVKDTQSFRSMSQADRLNKVGEMVAVQLKHDAAVKARRTELQIVAQSKLEAKLNSDVARGLTAAQSMQRILTFIADGKGHTQSITSAAEAKAHIYMRGLSKALDIDSGGSLWGLMTNKEGIEAIIREAYGENSGNAHAKKAWQEIDLMNQKLVKDFNEAGGDIRLLKDYRFPQAQDMFRVYNAGRDTWVNDALKNIDRSKYVDLDGNPLDDVKLKKFLNEAWETIAFNGYNKSGSRKEYASSIANRHKEHRQLHWKDADAYMDMMKKYGGGGLMEQISGHVMGVSREMALMDQFGPNSLHTIDLMVEKAKAIDKFNLKDKDYNKATKDLAIFEQMVDMVSGQSSGVAPDRIAAHRAFRIAKDINVFTLLGSILTSQLADNGTAMATVRALNMSMMQWGLHKTAYYGSPAMKDFARSAGVSFSMMANNMSRWGDDMANQMITGKLAATTMKISGSNFFTMMHREAFATFVLDQVGGMTRKYDWNTLPAADKDLLVSKGFTEQDWKILKAADVDDSYGGTGLGASQIERIPNSVIVKLIPDEVKRIYDETAAFMQKMDAQNLKETEWVQKRESKLNDAKQKYEKLLADMEAVREKRKGDLSERNLIRAGEMGMRMELAEIDMQIAKASVDELHGKRTDKFMDQVKRGVEWYGRRRSEIGERLGAQRHAAKLASSANDARIEKIGTEISEKFNSLFGPERTEDGLKLVGKVTAAIKEYEAYAQKMEDRIARATKRDGTPKAGKESTINRAELLSEQARVEFEAIKQRAEAAVENLRAKSEGKIQEIEALQKLVDQKRQRAETEADIAAYLETEKSLDKIEGALDALEFRASQGAERMGNEGERLGYRKGLLEAKLREMKRAEESYGKQAGKEVFAKAAEFEKRYDERAKDFDEFAKSMQERMDKRTTLASQWQANIGTKIDKAAEKARQDAMQKLTGMALEEAHMAVLQPSLRSKVAFQYEKGSPVGEIGSAVFHFKMFAWAFMRQHLMERPSMNEGLVNQWAYRGTLLAMTSVFGGLGLLMGDIASGRDPREVYDPENPTKSLGKFGFESVMKGGGLGILGDLLKTDWEGRDPIEQIAGPTSAKLHSVGKLGQEIYQAASGEEDTQVSRRFLDTGKQFLPFQNLIWTRAAFNNYLMSELNEMAQPGYQARMRGLAEKNYGSEYFMGMGNETRAPNFGNMVQP